MFTGLIEDTGQVVKTAKTVDGLVFSVECNFNTDEVKIGSSISVNGACQTVIQKNGQILDFLAMNETLRHTAPFEGFVNLEKALCICSRLEGHIISGHIDRTARVVIIKQDGAAKIFRFECETELIVLKGSIAINGISLTVSGVFRDAFEVSVLPHTLNSTNLQYLRRDDIVNIEYDMAGKYIQKFNAPKKEITREFLIENGF